MTRKRRPDLAPAMHPAARRRQVAAWQRWLTLQQEHRIASDRMWAGTIASSFTGDELALILNFISPHDRALFESVKRASQ